MVPDTLFWLLMLQDLWQDRLLSCTLLPIMPLTMIWMMITQQMRMYSESLVKQIKSLYHSLLWLECSDQWSISCQICLTWWKASNKVSIGPLNWALMHFQFLHQAHHYMASASTKLFRCAVYVRYQTLHLRYRSDTFNIGEFMPSTISKFNSSRLKLGIRPLILTFYLW